MAVKRTGPFIDCAVRVVRTTKKIRTLSEADSVSNHTVPVNLYLNAVWSTPV